MHVFFERNQSETAKKQQVLLFFVNTIWQLSSAALAAAICKKFTFN
jgi:hypothetical protein